MTRNSAARRRRERGQHAEYAGRDRDALTAVEPQPDGIDVSDDGGGAGEGRKRRPGVRRMRQEDRRRALGDVERHDDDARPVPVVRSTFAAPTFPLPATRTSIPARRASRNAKGTEPAR